MNIYQNRNDNHNLPVVFTPLYYMKDNQPKQVNKYAVQNPNNDQIYGYVSDKYQLIPHSEIVNSIKDIGSDIKTNTFINNRTGEMLLDCVYIGAKTDIVPGDTLYPKVSIRNSYSGKSSIRINTGSYRLVCSNGLMVSKFEQSCSIEHFRGSNVPIKDMFDRQIELFNTKLIPQFHRWLETPLDVDKGLAVVDTAVEKNVCGKKLGEAIRARWMFDTQSVDNRSMYGFFNTATYVGSTCKLPHTTFQQVSDVIDYANTTLNN